VTKSPLTADDIFAFSWIDHVRITPAGDRVAYVVRRADRTGVTTYGYPVDPKTDFGPYFGKAVGGLFARAARGK